MSDTRRPDATGPDYEYSLPIEAVADRYAAAGFPRTIRTLQRYCKSEHLDAQLVATMTGDKYFVAPYSVMRHLAQIAEMTQLTAGAGVTSRDTTRPAPTPVTPYVKPSADAATGRDSSPSGHVAAGHDEQRHRHDGEGLGGHDEPSSTPRQGATPTTDRPATAPGASRQDATFTDPGLSPKYVEVLECENAFLREQVTKKDQQIEALLERDRETNFLVQGLQRMLAPLLGSGGRDSAGQGETGRDTARG